MAAGHPVMVDETVGLPGRLDRRRHERVDGGSVAKVARQRERVAAERIAKGIQLVGVGTRHREPCALGGERLRDSRTDTARGAGDEGGHAGEIEHIRELLLFTGRSEEHTSELQSLMRISY